MEPEIQPPSLEPSPRTASRILKFGKRFIVALLLIAVGFVLGPYAAMLAERGQDKELAQQGGERATTAEFLATYRYAGASAVAHEGGITLYLLDHAKGEPYCGDHPRYTCKGTLYEIADVKLKAVASNVLGARLIYYEPGVRALLQSRWGDGSCREAKFYLYDFATASSSLSFIADNDCDGFEERNNEYQKAISDYLAPFGL